MKFQRSKVSVEIGPLNFRKVYNALRVMAEGNEDLPRDAQIVILLLKSMGVEDYEPRVVHQFLELWYRYAADVLTDAQVYSEHAGKTGIDCDDVKLAVQSKVNFSFSQPPSREVPLPDSMGEGTSIPLPPDDDTLVSPNYQLVIPNKQTPHAQEETKEEEEEAAAPSSSQEPKATHQPPQLTSQRVSFPLGSMRPQIQ